MLKTLTILMSDNRHYVRLFLNNAEVDWHVCDSLRGDEKLRKFVKCTNTSFKKNYFLPNNMFLCRHIRKISIYNNKVWKY